MARPGIAATPGRLNHATPGPARSGDMARPGIERYAGPVARPGIGPRRTRGPAGNRATTGWWPGRGSADARPGNGPAGYHGDAWASGPAGNRPICNGGGPAGNRSTPGLMIRVRIFMFARHVLIIRVRIFMFARQVLVISVRIFIFA